MSTFKSHYTPNIVLHLFALLVLGANTFCLQNQMIPFEIAYFYYGMLMLILLVRAVRKMLKPRSYQEGYTPPKEEPLFTIILVVSIVCGSLLWYIGYTTNTRHAFQIYMGYYLNPILMMGLVCILYKMNHYFEYKNGA